MKDFSFFLLKNAFGAKMKKGYRSFCNGDGSTSILNQRETEHFAASPYLDDNEVPQQPRTLEEMILQLEHEEKMARKAKLDEYGETRRRMSCVNNSDILRSARNALNQYPRFSLDGKDAMYRSTFRNSVSSNHGVRTTGLNKGRFDSILEKAPVLPPIVAGESVIWCKPGVVAKLMGLDAMPIPARKKNRSSSSKNDKAISSVTRKQNLMRKRAERVEMERRRLAMEANGGEFRRATMGSCSRAGYCVVKPVTVETANNGGIRRFQ